MMIINCCVNFRYTENPEASDEPSVHEIIAELKLLLGTSTVQPVAWLPYFFAVPGYVSVACLGNNPRYFAMDASSGYVAHTVKDVLERSAARKERIKVLDMCCCPGGKLMNTANYLCGGDILVGVDVSERRMDLCQALFRKNRGYLYTETGALQHQPRVLLCVADGTEFGPRSPGRLVFDSSISIDPCMFEGSRKRRNKSIRGRERKLLKCVQSTELSCVSEGVDNASAGCAEDTVKDTLLSDFDIVFVDAECSHDGSFRHLSECERSEMLHIAAERRGEVSSDDHTKGYTKKMASIKYETRNEEHITLLQRRLIRQGFRLLRPGGTLLYSTCSLSRWQNEDVVSHLLSEERTAVVEPVSLASTDLSCTRKVKSSTPEQTSIDKDPSISSLLSLSDEKLVEYFQADTFMQNCKVISDKLCEYVASRPDPPCTGSSLLPGSVLFNRHGGTSGLFVSRIKKLPPC